MEGTINTPHTCKVCQGKIVDEVRKIAKTDDIHMSIGEDASGYYRTENNYFCEVCGIKYEWQVFGPKPQSQILNEQEEERGEQRRHKENIESARKWLEAHPPKKR